MIKHCNAKRRGQKPYQAHIDWGKRVYGEEFRWDYKKSSPPAKQKTALAAVEVRETVVSRDDTIRDLEEQLSKLRVSEEVMVMANNQTQTKLGERSVALFKADFYNGEEEWMYVIRTIADSGGCENGINAEFAMEFWPKNTNL